MIGVVRTLGVHEVDLAPVGNATSRTRSAPDRQPRFLIRALSRAHAGLRLLSDTGHTKTRAPAVGRQERDYHAGAASVERLGGPR